jgi:hypothetical protein
MKRFLCVFIILVVVLGSFSACSSNGRNINEKPVVQQGEGSNSEPSGNVSSDKKTDDDGKAQNSSTELKIVENDTFSYLDEQGYLKLRSIKGGSESTLIDQEGLYDYKLDLKSNIAAYIVKIKDQEVGGNPFIYDMNTKTSEPLDPNDTDARALSWSTSGNYLVVDHGTSAIGMTKIYDLKNKKWLEVPTPEKTAFAANDYLWSEYGDVLALTVTKATDPPTPVESGDTFSAAVFMPETGAYKVLMEGNTDFGCFVMGFADKDNMYVKEQGYIDFDKIEYYKININDGTSVKVDESEVVPAESKLPEEVQLSLYETSPDEKLILYSFFDESSNKWKVMLYDVETQSKKELSIGSYPRWVSTK